MTFYPDWNCVHPEHKWKILRKQKGFIFWALYSSVGGVMYGFDSGLAGTATAFPAFQKQYGRPFTSQPSGYLVPANYQSGWAGASMGGLVVGVMAGGQILEMIGRKHSLTFGSLVTAVGVVMQLASHEWKLFLAGRLISAIGFGIALVEFPVWIGENTRQELRGFFLCLTNGSIVLGQFMLACISRGTSTIEGKWSYRTLIILQLIFVVILVGGYPAYPESPYYLLKKGHTEKARKALNRIHGSKDQTLIDAEIKRITRNVAFSEEVRVAASQKGPLIVQCFQGTNLKRTLIALIPVAGQQLIGAPFVLGYATYFLSLIGVRDYFTVSVGLYIVMLLSNISAFFFIETAGRRPLLVLGTLVLTLILLLMGIVGCFNGHGALWVAVVCMFVWSVAFQLTLGAVGFAIGSEVTSLPLRASTQSIVGFTQGFAGWLVGFVSPFLINPDAGNLGAKVGFVFAGLGVPLCVIFYFLIPETKGLSFDDMDYLFNNKFSCRNFQSAVKGRHGSSNDPLTMESQRQVPGLGSIAVKEEA